MIADGFYSMCVLFFHALVSFEILGCLATHNMLF